MDFITASFWLLLLLALGCLAWLRGPFFSRVRLVIRLVIFLVVRRVWVVFGLVVFPVARFFARAFTPFAPFVLSCVLAFSDLIADLAAHNFIATWLRKRGQAQEIRRLVVAQTLALADVNFRAQASIFRSIKFSIVANYANITHDMLVFLAANDMYLWDNGVQVRVDGRMVLDALALPAVPGTLRPLLQACWYSHCGLYRQLAGATEEDMAHEAFEAMLWRRFAVYHAQLSLLQGECIRLNIEAEDEILLG